MQNCTKCNHLSPDSEHFCVNCGADLSEYSKSSVDLRSLINNPRVTAIRISVRKNACPTCLETEGVYSKDNVPMIPVEGCSSPHGCHCQYAPVLEEIFP